MPRKDPEHLYAASVLKGADAGHYGLPAVILDARETHARLVAELAAANQAAVDINGPRLRAIDAALDGKSGPNLAAEVIAAEDARRLHFATVSLLTDAEAIAADQLLNSVRDSAREIVVAYLRPALEQTIAAIKPIAARFAAGVPDAVSFPHLAPAVRDAYVTLTAAMARYGAIRGAYTHLERLGLATARDTVFGEFRNNRDLYGSRWASRYLTGWTPGPDAPDARLLWIASGAAEPWIGLPEERDALFDAIATPLRTRPDAGGHYAGGEGPVTRPIGASR